MRRKRTARLLLVNLHATSKPWLVVPWLWAQIALRRVEAVLLQECTPAHRRKLERRRRWSVVGTGSEAIYLRDVTASARGRTFAMSPGWWGHQVNRQHPGRTLPLVLLAGWLALGSVHLPPAWWSSGVVDRERSGLIYLRRLRAMSLELGTPLLLGGDWNALPGLQLLEHARTTMQLEATGTGIDHVAARGCTVTRWRSVGAGPGMDHRAWLCVVKEGDHQ